MTTPFVPGILTTWFPDPAPRLTVQPTGKKTSMTQLSAAIRAIGPRRQVAPPIAPAMALLSEHKAATVPTMTIKPLPEPLPPAATATRRT